MVHISKKLCLIPFYTPSYDWGLHLVGCRIKMTWCLQNWKLHEITSSTSCDSNCADVASRDLSHLEKNKKH